ncbi:crotonase/enoyl-CoA hydratase family protein [Sphingobium sp. YR768]|uniref:crotonase/enoyl-CoA hydratase family protein n=1 Tax=Sphingobium sp. YR768 TaxID=1884365 RepID=UPI0008B585F8|nr:crotonase/enoyl-CoA hydratase family protein [Sphingobium sp. YR768]SER71302.1 Enoyl-CoA hydratase [Sphingobium sp. YR768]
MTDPEHFRFDVADGVAIITIDRADRLNAFTRPMAKHLVALFDRVDRDDAVRAVILTGEGRAFCAGADLSPGQSSLSSAAPNDPVDWSDPATRDFGGLITLRIYDCLKPVIVAFNGSAAGMGVTMALAADFRLASEEAKFALPFVRRGIVPESASSWFLPRIVGIAQALEWTLTGATFPAQEALRAGLVRSLHPPEGVLPAALALAQQIATHSAPVSVALTRQMLWRSLGMAHPMEAHRIESRGIHARARAADVREGVASFLEKRAPTFPDRVMEDMPSFFPWWDEAVY